VAARLEDCRLKPFLIFKSFRFTRNFTGIVLRSPAHLIPGTYSALNLSKIQKQMESRQLCKYFNTTGCCFGDECRYIHSFPPSSSMDPERSASRPRNSQRRTCNFFRSGCCRFGDRCHNLHSYDDIIDQPFIVTGESNEMKKMSGKEINEKKISGEKLLNKSSEDEDLNLIHGDEKSCDKNEEIDIPTCGICFETAIDSFGLLIGCDHAFCIECISLWRKEANLNCSRAEIEAKRGCPTCREHSDFVIPSNVYLTGSSKENLVRERLRRRELTPCRDWESKKSCK
jgi:hypothetical protein